MSTADQSRLAEAWRHCGLKVRGVWPYESANATTHRHPDHWQLVGLHKGSATYTSGSTQFHLHAGDVAIFRPGDVTKVQPEGPIHATVVLFSPIMAMGNQSALDLLVFPLTTSHPSECLLKSFGHGCDNQGWRHPQDAMRARFTIDQLLYDIACSALNRGDTHLVHTAPSWLLQVVKEARSQVKDAAFGSIDLVRMAGYSHGHFCRQLQHYYGCSPQAFIRKLRIDQLRHMVQADPTVPIDTLVTQCGFGTARRLHRQLRSATGVALKHIRQGNLPK